MRWRAVLIILLIPSTALSLYIIHLYRGLEESFMQSAEFKPTRIYSDTTQVSLGQNRARIKTRLQALGYEVQNPSPTLIQLTLRPIQFPSYLIPENHPQLDTLDRTVVLGFDGPGSKATLQTLQIGGLEVSSLYLEPELVATLSRGAREIRQNVQFANIPSPIWKAVIAVEDQYFLEHRGFDPRGFARAVWVNLKSLRYAQGGSTLTQQLVKNLTGHRQRSLFRKGNELLLALLLEIKYDKEQILERYLNEVNLGQVGSVEVNGISEGAKLFFGKNLSDLTLAESAFMMGLARGPDYYSPHRHFDRAQERKRTVLTKMLETGHIAEGEFKEALKQKILIAPPQTAGSKAPYFTDFVKAELIDLLHGKMTEEEIQGADLRVYTTLDLTLNSIAQQSVTQNVEQIERKQKKRTTPIRLEGTLAAVEHSTGLIRALVGGRNYGQSTFNRILNMRRQVGSTFKPIVYLTAFQKGVSPDGKPWTPASPVEDAPWKLIYDHGRQTWEPRNYESGYLGWTTYRTALAHSINTVAARLGVEVGLKNIIQTARSLGIQAELPEVPSLSLGVAEMSPMELLRAYATIANHGVRVPLTSVRAITHADGAEFYRVSLNSVAAIEPAAADLLTDVLQTVLTEGTARSALAMGLTSPAAGKTGTTSNYRDAWFAGYTPELTAVAWVGTDQDPNTPESKDSRIILTGASSALPVWTQFMVEAFKGDAGTPFQASSQLVTARIDSHTGHLATSSCPDSQVQNDKMITDRQPSDTTCEPAFPASSRVMNLDP